MAKPFAMTRLRLKTFQESLYETFSVGGNKKSMMIAAQNKLKENKGNHKIIYNGCEYHVLRVGEEFVYLVKNKHDQTEEPIAINHKDYLNCKNAPEEVE